MTAGSTSCFISVISITGVCKNRNSSTNVGNRQSAMAAGFSSSSFISTTFSIIASGKPIDIGSIITKGILGSSTFPKIITIFSSGFGSSFFTTGLANGSLCSKPVAIKVIPILSPRVVSYPIPRITSVFSPA